ncbi:biopolymer transporter Tol [Belliella kenyensis]|uniref:Biopolymer transporter Tol n=1 Tax=Belliella kenyensis TaxID=1472724 RepID=A0ABV8END6_9BACT|nr:biopolymer transporter Tol [Belliella kenyensis]MCH7400645.1 biopolymer transporter Tol [Belliella kenyensis]MDN3602068.1 biopolymer transporter Tol [Belliella kenyensis]
MKQILRYFILFVGLTLFVKSANAQFDQERFGKNRVQHNNIEWYYFSSNNFEVYYYDGGVTNARMAIDYLENEFDRLTQLIGYVAYSKPKIFIYNSPEEILQSNLNLNKDDYTVDGQTFFSRLLGEVAYPGTWEQFKKDLLYTTSKVIIEEMLYGATIADAFQSNLINSFPSWYVDGIAMYIGYGWSMEMDDYIRHYFRKDKKNKIHRIKEGEAALVGQSIWNYISEKYGRRYVSSILNLSRISRNEENSIANTLGVNYKVFEEDWKNYYVKTNESVLSTFKSFNESNVVTKTKSMHLGAINDIKFSPDGKHLAYVLNNGGKFQVRVQEVANKRERIILSGGSRSDDQPVNLTSPVIAWRDTLNLTIATFRRGTTTLIQRAIDGSNQDKIYLRNITQVKSIDYNSSGRNMVVSALTNGKTDIYTLNVRGVGKRLTNDAFDNLHPVFLNDSTIIFTSNATTLPDSVINVRYPDVRELPDYFNLFRIDLTDSSEVVTKLTNSNYRNLRPAVMNANFILHLSDQSGIMNLMRSSTNGSLSSQMSAFNRSLEAFDYNSRLNRVAYSYRDGNQSVLIVEPFSNSDQFTPSTPRVQIQQAKLLNERIASRRVEQQETRSQSTQVEINRQQLKVEETKIDTALSIRLEDLMIGGRTTAPSRASQQGQPIELNSNSSNEIMLDTLPPPSNQTGSINTERLRFETRGGIDTDNYSFDTIPPLGQLAEKPNTVASRSSLLENFRRQSMQKRIVGPSKMTPQFITTSLKTTFVVDPLRGFGISLNGQMSDLLDNHRIEGGIMTTLDFRSGSDIFFDYQYLKQRVDLRARFDRRAIQVADGNNTFQRYVLTKTELGFSYPFSVHSRVMLAPFVAKTQYFNLRSDSLLRAVVPEQNRFDVNYGGARVEFVVDKTEQLGLYMQQGLKGKIGAVHYQGLNESDRSFSNAYLDVRNYQKIHKNITLATRLFAGTFFGNNPQTYLVGGMDNWLFNQFYNPPSNRPEASPVRNSSGVENSNILFSEFVDLRGYDYDEIRGRNVITFTSELRLPLFSYLSRGNITSNFVKNFQLVAFYDIGTSWNESPPWERINDQNTEVINSEGSPFIITLNNFNNPWLQSYGAGLRTVLLNYYVKFDLARPVRNFQTDNLKFYVTLGYNF